MAASSCTIVGEMERAVSAKILSTKNRDCACNDDDDDDDMIKDISFHFAYGIIIRVVYSYNM